VTYFLPPALERIKNTYCMGQRPFLYFYALLCTGQLLVHPVALFFFIPSVFMLFCLISLHYVNKINKVMMMMMMMMRRLPWTPQDQSHRSR